MRVGLGLFLTSRCNLDCSYCYQNFEGPGERLAWNDIQAAVAAVAMLKPDSVEIVINGGEPLLEAGLLRRCIEEIPGTVPFGIDLSMRLITNGSLLGSEMTELLVENSVDLQISLHEHPNNVDFTATFALLEGIVTTHRDYADSHLSTATVVPARRVAGLARHVESLIALGVTDIRLAPPFNPDAGWSLETSDALRREFDTILELCTNHWRDHGSVPVALLRPSIRNNDLGTAADEQPICSAGSGTMFAVDPTGRAWACARFAGTLQHLPPLAKSASRSLDLGHVRPAELVDQLALMPEKVSRLRSFAHQSSKFSRTGNCADCTALADCRICPASICHCGTDPSQVPDHHCAFQRIVHEHRNRMADRIGSANLLLATRGQTRALQSFKEALEAELVDTITLDFLGQTEQ